MDETYTFISLKERTEITVKKSFLKICPVPSYVEEMTLISYNIKNYLHNLEGPALCDKNQARGVQYWINGRNFSKENWLVESHRIKFNNKIEDIINE